MQENLRTRSLLDVYKRQVLVTLRKNLRVDFYAEAGGLASELISSDLAISANKAQDAIHNFDTQVLPTGTGNNYNFHEIWTRGYNQIRNANVILSRIEMCIRDRP